MTGSPIQVPVAAPVSQPTGTVPQPTNPDTEPTAPVTQPANPVTDPEGVVVVPTSGASKRDDTRIIACMGIPLVWFLINVL